MAAKLNEDYIIHIKSSVEQGSEPETIELTTRGSFLRKNGSFFITYKETEATGYAGSTTTLKVAEDASRVAMLRYGRANAQLLIERGRRNVCHYETGYGSVTLGVTADEIRSELTEKGGRVQFSYMLDADSAELVSKSSLDVSVKHIN
ncbi:MAG: DUF1934 domain-containing protein [Faecalibacterium sp.]|jgi:uncharacterized beta-barrel protein YwiB (DUF1934 family)|nr:DUF1934 domain-containing protein [Faecalibacterium sp.]